MGGVYCLALKGTLAMWGCLQPAVCAGLQPTPLPLPARTHTGPGGGPWAHSKAHSYCLPCAPFLQAGSQIHCSKTPSFVPDVAPLPSRLLFAGERCREDGTQAQGGRPSGMPRCHSTRYRHESQVTCTELNHWGQAKPVSGTCQERDHFSAHCPHGAPGTAGLSPSRARGKDLAHVHSGVKPPLGFGSLVCHEANAHESQEGVRWCELRTTGLEGHVHACRVLVGRRAGWLGHRTLSQGCCSCSTVQVSPHQTPASLPGACLHPASGCTSGPIPPSSAWRRWLTPLPPPLQDLRAGIPSDSTPQLCTFGDSAQLSRGTWGARWSLRQIVPTFLDTPVWQTRTVSSSPLQSRGRPEPRRSPYRAAFPGRILPPHKAVHELDRPLFEKDAESNDLFKCDGRYLSLIYPWLFALVQVGAAWDGWQI